MPKDGFQNVLQFSSSLYDQSSFGGEQLSMFTRAFLEASVRKTDGTVYYTDVVNTLRDDFLGNDDQTPFFVSQGTGREILFDDATNLSVLRETLRAQWSVNGFQPDGDENGENTIVDCDTQSISPVDLLIAAEDTMGSPEEVQALINGIFDGVLEKLKISNFGEYFELATIEHSDYQEQTTQNFIVKVLSRETRPDRLVTAEISRKQKRRSPWESIASSLMLFNSEWAEHYDLTLNCTLERAQLRITLTPRYRMLQRLVLVLTCAPSLERLYLFEMLTQHPRSDWNTFDPEGREIVQRWYKIGWDESVDGLIEKICTALDDAVQEHVSEVISRLNT